MNGPGRRVPVRWARPFVVRCSCGWRSSSASEPGAQMIGEQHLKAVGLPGHVVLTGTDDAEDGATS